MLYKFTPKTNFLKDRTYGALSGPFDTKIYEQAIKQENSESGIDIIVPPQEHNTYVDRTIIRNFINPYVQSYKDYMFLERKDDDIWTDEFIEKYHDARNLWPLFTKLDRIATQYTAQLDGYGWPGNPWIDIKYSDNNKNYNKYVRQLVPSIFKMMKDGINLQKIKELLNVTIDDDQFQRIINEFGYPPAIDQNPVIYPGGQTGEVTTLLDSRIGVLRAQGMDVFSDSPFKILDIGILSWIERNIKCDKLLKPALLEITREVEFVIYRRPIRHTMDIGIMQDQAFFERENWVENNVSWVIKQEMGKPLLKSLYNIQKYKDEYLPIEMNQLYDTALATLRAVIDVYPISPISKIQNKAILIKVLPIDVSKQENSPFTTQMTPEKNDFNKSRLLLNKISKKTDDYKNFEKTGNKLKLKKFINTVEKK